MTTCDIEGCESPIVHRTSGYCNKHYHRWRRYGDPTYTAVAAPEMTAKQRLEGRYRITDTGCWEWTRATDGRGYGIVNFRGKSCRAHRLSYTAFKGEIPPGLVVMHACDNPPCINPDHLSIGTTSDNIRDAVAKKRHPKSRVTECPAGHSYAEYGMTTRRGHRKCRECDRTHQRTRAKKLGYWPRGPVKALEGEEQ